MLIRADEAPAFQAYPLRHVQAAEVELPVQNLLAGMSNGFDVVVDARNNRLLVRGEANVQQVARQLIETLDRPTSTIAEPTATAATLRSYPVAATQLAATAARWQKQFASNPQVRIAADERTSQVLVVAPPDVHANLAEASGPPASPVGSPTPTVPAQLASPPSAAVVTPIVLQRTTWAQMEGALRQIYGDRLWLAPSTPGNLVTAAIAVAGQPAVQLTIDPQSNRVEFRGAPEAARSCARLITALDEPQLLARGQRRVMPVPHSGAERARRTAEVFRTVAQRGEYVAQRGDSAARRGDALGQAASPTTALAMNLFQPRAAEPAAPPAPNGPPAVAADAPAAAKPAAQIAAGSGLTGPVQIEFLEGLDVLIVSGNDRDVQRVMRILEDIERLSVETDPTIEVLPLKHIGSDVLAGTVSQLYDQVLAPRQGRVTITALAKPNSLLLVGRDESVRSARELIERLDQPVSPTDQFAVFALEHAAVGDVQATVQEFFAGRTGLGGKVQVTSDIRGNALIVQASPRDLLEVGELIRRLDVSSSSAVNELRVFPLETSLAEELAEVLQSAISGQSGGGVARALAAIAQGPGGAGGQGAAAAPGGARAGKSTMLRFMTIDAQGQRQLRSGILSDVQITADPRANALLVSAPTDSMELIGALIKQLDQIPAAESQIKVFTIVNGDASSLVQMLESLFGRQNQAGGAGGGGALGAAAAQAASFQGENPLVSLRFSVDQRTNSVIASGSAGDLNVVEAILLRLDDSNVRQRQSQVYRLRNAPSLDVANAINQFLRNQREVQQISPGLLTPFEQIEREVIVVPEPVSNSLIVSATPRFFDDIRKIVEDLDRRPPMVMIQVLIAQITLNNTDEFGIEAGLQDTVLFDRSLLGDLVTTTNSTQTPNGNTVVTSTNQVIQAATNTPGYNFNNQPLGNSGSTSALSNAAAVGAQGLTNFSLGRTNSTLGYGGLVLSAASRNVSLLIRALQASQRLEVLSRPQIMTLDNQAAFIQVGARVPRVQGLTQPTVVGQAAILNVTDVNVGLILGVTPRISPDGLVVMEIDAENSSLGPEAQGVAITASPNGQAVRQPLINTTTAQTTVSALTGQTVVLGGLLTKGTVIDSRRVPFLSKIPIVGNLFRYDSEVVTRTELLIIMTPHIIRTEEDAEQLKQIESARMSWCLADVNALNGETGLRSRDQNWLDQDTTVIYPDETPDAESILAPAQPQPGQPTTVPAVPTTPPANLQPALPQQPPTMPPNVPSSNPLFPPGMPPSAVAPPGNVPPTVQVAPPRMAIPPTGS